MGVRHVQGGGGCVREEMNEVCLRPRLTRGRLEIKIGKRERCTTEALEKNGDGNV